MKLFNKCVKEGDKENLCYLLRNPEFDINSLVDDDGQSPLSIAVTARNTQLVEELLFHSTYPADPRKSLNTRSELFKNHPTYLTRIFHEHLFKDSPPYVTTFGFLVDALNLQMQYLNMKDDNSEKEDTRLRVLELLDQAHKSA